MNELTLALESTFDIIGNNLGLFVGIPLAFTTLSMAIRLAKIMFGITCRSRPVCVAESAHPLSNRKMYIPPLLDFQKCPVSDECEKCRFYNTDRCLRKYLYE